MREPNGISEAVRLNPGEFSEDAHPTPGSHLAELSGRGSQVPVK